jgi:hypothetical protein
MEGSVAHLPKLLENANQFFNLKSPKYSRNNIADEYAEMRERDTDFLSHQTS